MTYKTRQEEIDRLARLCETKDAEIAIWKKCAQDADITICNTREKLSEAQAQIAMLRCAIQRIVNDAANKE